MALAPIKILDADLNPQFFTPNDDPAKGAKQEAGNLLLQDLLDALTTGTATAALQTSGNTLLSSILAALTSKVGTRAYGTPTRVAVAAASALSSPITATEVLLHASTKMYVRAVAGTGTPTVSATDGIPLEAGEKFHMQITSGQRIAVIRDSADGFLHIVPVVG